jgi:glycosyltransferase involved in cell wall biosynthesis
VGIFALHFWAPNLFGYAGGLQKHLYTILLAVRDLLGDSPVKVFSKLDKKNSLSEHPVFPYTDFYPMGGVPAPFRNIVFAFRIFCSALIHRPGLIIVGHVNFSPVAYLIKRLTGIPYWIVTYGIEAWGTRSALLRRSVLAADHILAMSHFTEEKITGEFGMPAGRVSVLPGSCDFDLFRIKPKPQALLDQYGLNATQPVILTVCRLDRSEQYKGCDKVIEAMPGLIRKFPDIRYILIGYGSDRDRVQALVRGLQLDKHVILPGKITGEELCDHYNLCDVFAMPSKGEGFGIVFLEALACGKPVLAGNQDGSVDALRNGELGVLVDPNDAGQIEENLFRILNHEHPNKTLYDPQLLRRKAIGYFGFDKFKSTLSRYLNL